MRSAVQVNRHREFRTHLINVVIVAIIRQLSNLLSPQVVTLRGLKPRRDRQIVSLSHYKPQPTGVPSRVGRNNKKNRSTHGSVFLLFPAIARPATHSLPGDGLSLPRFTTKNTTTALTFKTVLHDANRVLHRCRCDSRHLLVCIFWGHS